MLVWRYKWTVSILHEFSTQLRNATAMDSPSAATYSVEISYVRPPADEADDTVMP